MDYQHRLQIYRSKLPHGTKKEIATKVGVSPQAVNNFLKGRNKSLRIENAILEKLAELRRDENLRMKKAGLL